MSGVYIQGIVDNIKSDSTPYTPIIEAITNSIDSIDKSCRSDGRIDIYLERKSKLDLDDELQEINTIQVVDNGIGFTEENRNSFDTLYSPQKKEIGGKGFGRFFYLKHFYQIFISSVYKQDDVCKKRTFEFGRQFEVVTGESDILVTDACDTGSELTLKNIKLGVYDKDHEIFAHRLLEKLLSYFVDKSYHCPTITIHDNASSKTIILNNIIGTDEDSLIQNKKEGSFVINEISFNYRMFKILRPRNQKSKIILTARNQGITDKSLDLFLPDFSSEFSEDYFDENNEKQSRNFIVKFYVQAKYLDENVTAERDSFNFGDKHDAFYPVDRDQIENQIVNIAKETFHGEVSLRSQEKKKKVQKYADKNIWYRPYVDDIDFEKLKPKMTEIDIEMTLHQVKYEKDLEIKRNIREITKSNTNFRDANQNAEKLIQQVKDASISDLAHYIAFRKSILDLFRATVQWDSNGDYDTEKAVHDIIFPTKKDSEETSYYGHNLWIIDEGLNLTQYLSSDKNIFNNNNDRPDIAAFHFNVAYREGSEPSNPVSVFEFKRPSRNDFVNPSSKEDPVGQIIRYVNSIRNGDYKTPKGMRIHIEDTTPFYGYIVADVDTKVEKWLEDEKNFKRMPDGKGWFYIQDNINLNIEFITWEKLINDAEIRHRIFFEKLGLEC